MTYRGRSQVVLCDGRDRTHEFSQILTEFDRSGILRLALFAHELGEIVVAARRLARRPGHFPSAEWLHAHDGPCRCPRGAIRVEDAGYNFGEEPADLGRLAGKDAAVSP